MFWRLLYSFLWLLCFPGILFYFVYRGSKNPAYFNALFQRFSLYSPGIIKHLRGRCIHVHCASLGEVNALSALLPELLKAYPESPLLVTNSTPAGAQRVHDLFGDQVSQLMAPLDGFFTSHLFVICLKPRVSLFSEVEIWPNWLAALAKNERPLILLNARLSKKSARKYARLAALFKPALQRFTAIYGQDKASTRRYHCFNPATELLGNLKFVQPTKAPELPVGVEHKYPWPQPVWIAGSVHPEELDIILSTQQQLRAQIPNALLILAPRHLERFSLCLQQTQAAGLSVVQRSLHQQPTAGEAVWLLDTLGELKSFYGLANIAFVGGSLIERGGHNPLEPAGLGLPVIMGPSQTNCLASANELKKAGGLKTVQTSEQLLSALMLWWQDGEAYQQASEAGPAVVNKNNQVLSKQLVLLRRHIS
ncbi:3-deoxy-D-manno-octulosonic acid transferase [Gayadomonas joobiniege]|uniref:3-deoxy-D-manno-octulosonic acid transferase n=1 Tax=Gayadomonas joobiniege TaxID=1234606 RepID=UPI00037604B4|nr:3-deoxy-D-manno-octulosonic acid transferase [Gayadomonas joobiniege]